MILLMLFSIEIEYGPNNLKITSGKKLFLPISCSPMITCAVSVLIPGF
jgi:hypothetical protein